MSNVVPLHRGDRIDDLWEAYRSLVAAQVADPRLRLNHEHSKSVVRAWKRWSDAFIAQDGRS